MFAREKENRCIDLGEIVLSGSIDEMVCAIRSIYLGLFGERLVRRSHADDRGDGTDQCCLEGEDAADIPTEEHDVMIGIQLTDLNEHASVELNTKEASADFVEFLDDVFVGRLDLQLVGLGIPFDRDRCHHGGDLREILLPEFDAIHVATVRHARNQKTDHWHRQGRLDTGRLVTGSTGRRVLTNGRL